MKSITAVALAMMGCGLPTSAYERSEAGGPATAMADKPDADGVQWRAHCDLDDGRRFLTDGSLLLESRYLPAVPVPEKRLPPQAAQRLLGSETDREFGLADLERKSAGGHYVAPGGIALNRKYVLCLRGSPLKATLRFRAKGPNDPVLILDGKKVVGVMMPIKT
jgi:hypothetical protein